MSTVVHRFIDAIEDGDYERWQELFVEAATLEFAIGDQGATGPISLSGLWDLLTGGGWHASYWIKDCIALRDRLIVDRTVTCLDDAGVVWGGLDEFEFDVFGRIRAFRSRDNTILTILT